MMVMMKGLPPSSPGWSYCQPPSWLWKSPSLLTDPLPVGQATATVVCYTLLLFLLTYPLISNIIHGPPDHGNLDVFHLVTAIDTLARLAYCVCVCVCVCATSSVPYKSSTGYAGRLSSGLFQFPGGGGGGGGGGSFNHTIHSDASY